MKAQYGKLTLGMALWGVLQMSPAALMAEEKGGLEPIQVGSGTLQLDGLLQLWFVHDPENIDSKDSKDTFRLRRAEIKLSGEIAPKIQWAVMFDPAKELKLNTATTPFTVDQQSKILQDFFFRIGYIPHHLVDLGQFKIPITEEGRRSSSQLDTIERSIIGRTYGDKRDIGVQAAGNFPWAEYRIGLFNGEGINQTDKNDQKDYTGLLIFKPAPGLEVGGSGYGGSVGKGTADKDRYGPELRYHYRDVSFKGEAMWARDGTTRSNGWYVQMGYFILPKQLHGVAKYEGFDPDQSKSNDRERDLTLGINYFIKGHNAKAQLNYIRKDFQAARSETDVNQILAAMQIAF